MWGTLPFVVIRMDFKSDVFLAASFKLHPPGGGQALHANTKYS
jgi:hypothetical protein